MTSWDRMVAAGRAQSNADLARLTTYKLGGAAAYLVEMDSVGILEEVAANQAQDPRQVLVMGRGSNLVVADSGYDGVVIHVGSQWSQTEVAEDVTAQAGAGLPTLARAASKAGRMGLEFMVGIPGTVGGGVRQNAGCFGSDMERVLVDADIFNVGNGDLSKRSASELRLGYRHSNVAPTEVVVGARFRTESGQPARGEEKIREITKWRRIHQPGGTLNAGSVFKNPPGDAAGRIIDSLGLKGMRVGGAVVSEKHANFFVAMPGTRSLDIYLLVRKVAGAVLDATGIVLEPEIQFAGRFEEEA
ncbi:MAG: UDP-N-acetylmuramate dehydrogenase [Actinomycetota bacterium]